MSEGLKELYIDELKDLYNAENQTRKSLAEDGQGCHIRRVTPGI